MRGSYDGTRIDTDKHGSFWSGKEFDPHNPRRSAPIRGDPRPRSSRRLILITVDVDVSVDRRDILPPDLVLPGSRSGRLQGAVDIGTDWIDP